MNSPDKMFPIRKGTNSIHGADFEKEMTTFFLVQCLSSNLKDFAICSNVDGLGAWDDVLLYTKSQDKNEHLSFMQLKHKLKPKDKTELLTDKEFNKYLTDYSKIVNNKFSPNIKSLVRSFNVDNKNMRFLFYTNAESGNILREVNKLYNSQNNKTTDAPDIKALATNPNVEIYQLPNDKINVDAQFEKQFYLYTNQITVSNKQLQNVIKAKIENFHVKYLDFQDFHLKLIEEITHRIESGRILCKSDLENMFRDITLKHLKINPISEEGKLFWKTFVLTPVTTKEGFTLSTELIEMGKYFTVNFHGIQIPFDGFVKKDPTENIIKAFKVNDIIRLITGGLTIGKELDIPKYYVERISPRIYCNSSIFQESADNFAILASSDSFEKYKAQGQRVNIAPDKLQLVKTCNEIKFTENFHILKLCQDQDSNMRLEWLHSETGDIKPIVKHSYTKQRKNKHLSDEVEQDLHKKILVLADPGMGKSMFLKRLHNTLPHKYWPMFVTINDLDYTKIVNFASLADWYRERLQTDLEKHVFEFYRTKRDVIILFDGYDEIHYNYVKSLNDMISDAITLKINIVVCSRYSKKEQLEEILQIHSNTLVPFNTDNKQDFLKKYFSIQNQGDENLLQIFVDNLLEFHTFSKWENSFTGIPLQLYMLAESYAEEWRTYLETQKCRKLKSLKIIDLYQTFIDKTFDRYLRDKRKLDGCSLEHLKDFLKDQFLVVHCNAALQLLLPELNVIISKKELESNMQYGLITAYNFKGDPEFVHRTFAEYLAAVWFAQNKNNPQNVQAMLLLMKPGNSVILDLFDRMVCKDCPLHLNVLDNDIDSIERKIEERKTNKLTETPLDAKQCGRSSLHLIACRGMHHELNRNKSRIINLDKYFLSITENETRLKLVEVLLTNCKRWNNEPDEIFKRTPFETVWNRNAFEFVFTFLQWKIVDSISPENMKVIKDNWEKILFICEKQFDTLAEGVMQALNLNVNEIQSIKEFRNARNSPVFEL